MQQKQIIRLHDQGYSLRRISRELGVHRKTVKAYIEQFKQSDLTVAEALDIQTDLSTSLPFKSTVKEVEPRLKELKQFLDDNKNLRRQAGFTIKNLYKDYIELSPNCPYSRATFYRLTHELWDVERGSMRLNHKHGEKLFVDYSGKKLSYVDKETGEEILVEVLVTILPASQYIYVEAMHSQKQEDFIHGIMNALDYIGGCPKSIVTDNLKSAVTKAGKYQSVINKSLQAMALHYNTTIDPTRTYHPKDKALVEGAVKISYQSIYYIVQKQTYFSLSDLNAAIRKELTVLNARILSNSDDSRHDRYLEEKSYLSPLPIHRYELKQYRIAKVQKMGYVLCSGYKNYYSVPYRYIGKQVELRYNTQTVEIFYQSVRIALHTTSQAKGQYITIPDHLSSNNKAYSKWSPEYFSQLAAKHSKDIQTYVDELIECKPYPEQAYKQVQGILALVKLYTVERVSKACVYASQHHRRSYQMIQEILANNQDLQESQDPQSQKDTQIPQHDNLRGSDYYK